MQDWFALLLCCSCCHIEVEGYIWAGVEASPPGWDLGQVAMEGSHTGLACFLRVDGVRVAISNCYNCPVCGCSLVDGLAGSRWPAL